MSLSDVGKTRTCTCGLRRYDYINIAEIGLTSTHALGRSRVQLETPHTRGPNTATKIDSSGRLFVTIVMYILEFDIKPAKS